MSLSPRCAPRSRRSRALIILAGEIVMVELSLLDLGSCATPVVPEIGGGKFGERPRRLGRRKPRPDHSTIEIEIVYNMYRMRQFTTTTVCAVFCLWALPTMPYKKLISKG
jgi:hypothetical protein